MSQAVLTLQLPDDVYEHVRRAAKGMKEPVETALVRIVRAATPSLKKVPRPYRAELEALEEASDARLWQVARDRLPATQERRLGNLLDKNQRGKLSDRERQELSALRAAADQLMLRRAYAFLLLKYRGQPVPDPVDQRP